MRATPCVRFSGRAFPFPYNRIRFICVSVCFSVCNNYPGRENVRSASGYFPYGEAQSFYPHKARCHKSNQVVRLNRGNASFRLPDARKVQAGNRNKGSPEYACMAPACLSHRNANLPAQLSVSGSVGVSSGCNGFTGVVSFIPGKQRAGNLDRRSELCPGRTGMPLLFL